MHERPYQADIRAEILAFRIASIAPIPYFRFSRFRAVTVAPGSVFIFCAIWSGTHRYDHASSHHAQHGGAGAAPLHGMSWAVGLTMDAVSIINANSRDCTQRCARAAASLQPAVAVTCCYLQLYSYIMCQYSSAGTFDRPSRARSRAAALQPEPAARTGTRDGCAIQQGKLAE